MNIVLIDNFDSFTYNLRELIEVSAQDSKLSITVIRSDESIKQVQNRAPDILFISPGPSRPDKLSLSYQAIHHYHKTHPIFGVCLGMQYLNEYFGGETIHAPTPVHGKTSVVTHRNSSLFQNLPSQITVARYHSLAIKPSDAFEVTMEVDGIPMSITHKHRPLYGVQFHPESFLSDFGQDILKNFFSKIKDHNHKDLL